MNKKMRIGLILIITIIILSIIGAWITPYDINYSEGTKYENGIITSPPHAPSFRFLLGTDRYGYDMLTKILYGARYTIFTVITISFFRILLGSGVGILLGIKTKRKHKSIIDTAWGAIPSFIVVYFLLVPFNFKPEVKEVSYPVLFFTLFIFIGVGIPSIISNMRARTELLMEREFINAAKVLGANSIRIMIKHIIPHLKESMITLFVTEIVLVLTLFGQLGIFDIFIGGTVMYFDPIEFHSITNEWAGLIGQMRGYIYTNRWILLAPMSAYLILIFSFQLLSSGLNEYYKKKLHNYPYIQ